MENDGQFGKTLGYSNTIISDCLKINTIDVRKKRSYSLTQIDYLVNFLVSFFVYFNGSNGLLDVAQYHV